MDLRKVSIIYVVSSFFWNSLCLMASIFFQKNLLMGFLSGVLSLTLMSFGFYVFHNRSRVLPYFKNYVLPFVIMLLVALFEIYIWYLVQDWLVPPKAFDVYLISGIGIVVISIVALLTVGVQTYLQKKMN